jgi:hypothetical protein
MAINKNFVIKNGVEVNTNLLVGDSTLNKVGIATTVPGYTLHIGVGDGARGGIGATDITVTGIATIGVANSTSGALSVTGISTFEGLVDANGGVSARTAAVQDLTDNRVVIAGSGGELEDSANLTFDGSTLTVSGDLDPTNVSIASTLQVAGVATFLSGVLVSGIGTFDSDIDAEGTVTVGTGITLQPHGGVSIAGIVTVGGDLNVTGDYSVDEISARNLILTGIATIPTLAVTGIGTFEKLTVGTGVTLQEHGGVSIAGITTANQGVRVNADSGNSSAASATNYFSVGASEDLKIYHNGGTNYIAAPNGDIEIKSDNFKVVSDDSSGRAIFVDNSNSRLELGFDGNHDAHYTGSGIDFLNDVDIDDTTQSTSTTTGALKVDGGVGVAKNLNVGGETVLQAVRIAGVSTISDNVNISGVTTTGENLGGFKRLVGAASSTVVSIAVTVAAKTADHRYFGQGSDNGYWLDGVQSPFLTLVPGKLYYFDQSHSTNSSHPLRFYIEQDKANAYTTEITTGGTPGSSGAYTQIGIGTASNENNHPAVLHYQCSSHALMGNAVATQSNAVNLPDSVVTTVRGNLMPGADSSYDIGASGTRFTNIYGDTLYGDGSNLTNLPTQVSIANNADNRVITGGSGVNLNGEANLTFDGSTLGITGSIDLSADIDVDGTANLDILDVDGASNFGADVVFAGAAANITFDQSEDDLIFNDNAQAVFGTGSDLKIFHDGSNSNVSETGTGSLILNTNGADIQLISDGSENMARFSDSGSVELYHNNVKIFETTGIGITVGLSSVQHNGNAAFPGITTLGSPGGGSRVIVNNLLNVNSGANITGIATLAQAYIAKLAQSNGTSGSVNEVPVANGSGGWSWAPVNTAGASVLQGITVQEEGSNVGTAGSIATLNFVGGDVTADATAQQGICTVTIDSSIQGITTSGTSFLHDITQTGVTTLTSDQQAAFNVGTAATIYSAGNIRTVGVITAHGGLVVGDTTDASSGGGLLVGTAGTIQSNGAAAFAGIVTAGGGFNIGIQSAGIVIAKNVGINTLNFVGSGNSITYFAATNTLDVSIAGSSGGGGGVSETSTSVSTTSATSCGSFAKASKRSASVLAQITQGSAYQVGRYLVIHDGTTVTTVEESAVATGSMLGTFEGVINGDDVEFRVTMSSSSSATVITKIDSISS